MVKWKIYVEQSPYHDNKLDSTCFKDDLQYIYSCKKWELTHFGVWCQEMYGISLAQATWNVTVRTNESSPVSIHERKRHMLQIKYHPPDHVYVSTCRARVLPKNNTTCSIPWAADTDYYHTRTHTSPRSCWERDRYSMYCAKPRQPVSVPLSQAGTKRPDGRLAAAVMLLPLS